MDRVPHLRRRSLLQATGAAASIALCPRLVRAQDALLKTATIVVGSPPGGATDKMTRLYAEGLRGRYAENVLVENKPGAGGVIAYDYVRRSASKDGSLVFLSPAYPIVITPHLVGNLPYDTLKDFVPVAPTGRSGMTYAVGPGVPDSVRSFEDYLAWARLDPKKNALYGAQTGSSQHLLGAVTALSTGVPLENVSYKGDAPAVTDMLGGHVPAAVLPISSALPLMQQGKARILAVARSTRSRFMPQVPTFIEAGYKEVLFQDWLGVFAPAGTPTARVRQLNEAINQVARSPQGAEGLQMIGIEAEIVTADAFAGMVRTDWQRYERFIERTKFKEIYEKAQGGTR